MRLLMLCWLAILALVGAPAHAALPARPDGPILDAAGIIPADQKAALDQKLRAYARSTGRPIVVVTVPTLDGQVIERYAQDLARAWDIGGKESQEGVLFLIAPVEHKIRIHPAVGAQGRLTDGFLGRTIREVIAPRFKAGDMGGGITAGVDAVIAQMNRDPTDAKAVAEAAAAAEAQQRAAGQGDAGAGSVVFWIVLILFFMFVFGRRGRRFGQRSGIDPAIVLWGISEAMLHGNRGSGWGGGIGGGSSGGSGGGGSDWGGFGGGGGGFDGGGASGDW